MRPRHPKKEVETVLKYAELHGFTVLAPRAHWASFTALGSESTIAYRGRSVEHPEAQPRTPTSFDAM
jgi:hypothetical protein